MHPERMSPTEVRAGALHAGRPGMASVDPDVNGGAGEAFDHKGM